MLGREPHQAIPPRGRLADRSDLSTGLGPFSGRLRTKSNRGICQKTRARLAESPADALKIARAGERWPESGLASDQVALWTLVCNLVLNLDETVTRN